LTFN
jgi:hypothetical protein